MTSICIVGAGVTGLSMLLLLHQAGYDLSKVAIIDPHFDGGDLARRWTAVQSNTPWSKTLNALRTTCPSLQLPSLEGTSKLVDIAHLIRELTTPALKQVTQIQGVVTQANYISYQQIWKVQYGTQTLSTKKLILAPGGEPKALDLPMSSIPLEIAIDQTRLQHYVKPGDKALVFGTLHSGTLVIRNLAAIGADVTAFYNSPLPFYWSRDGAYDGIKEEAAQIADDIVAGKIAVKLVSNKDTSAVIRASSGAKWVTYAMGFQPRLVDIRIDGTPRSPTEYNGATGKMYYGAWGFGIAYPNLAPDGIHRDVSVAAFLEHMKRQIPEIADM